MKNLPFVLWMLGFPVLWSMSDYLAFLQGKTYPDVVVGIGGAIMLAIWTFVGSKLYEKEKK